MDDFTYQLLLCIPVGFAGAVLRGAALRKARLHDLDEEFLLLAAEPRLLVYIYANHRRVDVRRRHEAPARYVKQLLHGDFGYSYVPSSKVWDLIREAAAGHGK